jgi:hypothetical protein
LSADRVLVERDHARQACFANLASVAAAAPARAREITVTLRFDPAFVRRALLEQIYTGPGERASIFDDGKGCGWLDLYEPRVEASQAALRIISRGEARIGTPIAGQCLVALEWKGFVEVLQEPQLDASGRAVVFKTVDSNVYDEKHQKRFTTGGLWDLVKSYVHPRLEALRIDLALPFAELRAWLPLVLPRSDEQISRLLNSLAVRDPRVSEGRLAATLVFDVAPRAPSAPPAAVPTLSPEELQRWQTRWQQWDAFLTFVVKRFAGDAGGELRRAVLDVLLEARHELLEALVPPHPGAPDPVPKFFVRTWERLAPLLHEEAAELPAATALQYASFIAAGDALVALEELGPEIGVEISADGLRRLARMVAPASVEDPVEYSTALDPELRTLLGFGPPLPSPEISPEVDLEARSPFARSILALTRRLRWPFGTAWAAIDPEVVARLNRWSPTGADLETYLPLVRDLLREASERTLSKKGLGEVHRTLYRHLVLATAWQESCWRQFVRRGGKLVPLKSTVGSVGIMQVNQNVWRGVYDVRGLLGDVQYNSRAGSEILLHYMKDYAIAKGEHEQSGGFDNLARATYAVYNGGPGHRTRYRAKNPKRSLKKIDDLFFEKYVAVREGRELDVASCYGG